MLEFDEIVAKASSEYYPMIQSPYFDFIEASRQDNPFWEVADFLEIALLQGIVVDDEFLSEIEKSADTALPADIIARVLELISKHKARNAALAKQ